MRTCPQCSAMCSEEHRFCARCGTVLVETATSSTDPLIGRTIGGSYTLQELIGVGGMGRVYRAEQGALGRTVAVKVIHPHLLGDEQTVARFYTEARAASRLNHPNSVGIIDFGRTDDGILYLAMEFLTGQDLSLVMNDEGPLAFTRICHILDGVLAALSEAHALGVVHRDLKPENIILKPLRSGTDLVKVVDFGLATIVGGGGTSITTPGLVCGTPDYMAPEQGQGERVDGRSDLYSLGVVLFELLTDQLPYPDETPTKVVLRHIHDPIPDPRVVSPQRNIPESLVRVVQRALAKKRDDRYQSPEEMQRALQPVVDQLRGRRIEGSVECATCGASNPTSMRFCGACGSRLTGPQSSVAPPVRVSAPSRSSFAPLGREHSPLVGRNEELAHISSLLAESNGMPVWLRILGEPGVGKTRLLEEIGENATQTGDLVVVAGPHPTGAPVPYGAVRQVLSTLLDIEEGSLTRIVGTGGAFNEPLLRAGAAELVQPSGLPGIERKSRAGAVAAVLLTAIRSVFARNNRRVVILVDDFSRCDLLSQQAINALPAALKDGPLFLVTAEVSNPNIDGSHVLVLGGLDAKEAGQLLAIGPHGTLSRAAQLLEWGDDVQYLPLYIDQVRALAQSLGPGEKAPLRIADAVAQRIDRLGVSARRVLQAIAVLGDRCALDWLRELVDPKDMPGIDALRKEGLVRVTGEEIEVTHPFVRDLVEASIPAEARKTLHQRAFEVASDRDAPLEVRAEHAFRAGEAMGALMLLERMGDVALARGDAATAVLGFRRALDLARREMVESGDAGLETAIVTFSRKLGEALEGVGDAVGADGVLREALDLTGPASPDRARMLLAIGRIASRRDRRREAVRLLGQALELATREKLPAVEATVQLTIARIRSEESDHIGAANAYRRALELFEQSATGLDVRAQTAVELGEVLLEIGDREEAMGVFERAMALADTAQTPSIGARVVGIRASLAEMEGNLSAAASFYQDAARLAAEAGDADSHHRWRRAARAVARPSD